MDKYVRKFVTISMNTREEAEINLDEEMQKRGYRDRSVFLKHILLNYFRNQKLEEASRGGATA